MSGFYVVCRCWESPHLVRMHSLYNFVDVLSVTFVEEYSEVVTIYDLPFWTFDS